MLTIRFLWIPIPLLLLTLGGCGSAPVYISSKRHVELKRVPSAEERLNIYELNLAADHRDMTLVVKSQFKEDRADLGVRVRELDKELARQKLLTPYTGLLVDSVERQSPADQAGIIPGDILVRIEDVDVIYMDQYQHILENRLAPDALVKAQILRPGKAGSRVDIEITPRAKSHDVVDVRSIPLDRPWEGGRDYSGIIYGGLDAEWSRKIYDTATPTIVIGGVYIGSPAYRAGIRSGDRIVAINGQTFEDVNTLKDWLQDYGSQGESVTFDVYHVKGGSFETEVDLKDYHGQVDINVPLIFDLESDFVDTEWSLGPFSILLDYEGRYHRASSREANYEREFCLLWGLFATEWSPSRRETTFLWFITIDS